MVRVYYEEGLLAKSCHQPSMDEEVMKEVTNQHNSIFHAKVLRM